MAALARCACRATGRSWGLAEVSTTRPFEGNRSDRQGRPVAINTRRLRSAVPLPMIHHAADDLPPCPLTPRSRGSGNCGVFMLKMQRNADASDSHCPSAIDQNDTEPCPPALRRTTSPFLNLSATLFDRACREASGAVKLFKTIQTCRM